LLSDSGYKSLVKWERRSAPHFWNLWFSTNGYVALRLLNSFTAQGNVIDISKYRVTIQLRDEISEIKIKIPIKIKRYNCLDFF